MRAQDVDAVRDHRTLRTPGAATGEEHDVRVGLTEPRLVDVGVVLAGAQTRELDERDTDPRRDRSAVGGALGVGGDRRRLRRRDHHVGLFGCEHRADRREHRAELRQRDEQREHVEGGVVPRHHAVGVTHAERGERARHLVAAPVELGVGDRLVAAPRGDAARVRHGPRSGRCRRSAGRQAMARASRLARCRTTAAWRRAAWSRARRSRAACRPRRRRARATLVLISRVCSPIAGAPRTSGPP